MMSRHLAAAATLAALATLAAAPAGAKVIAHATYHQNFTFSTSTAAVPLWQFVLLPGGERIDRYDVTFTAPAPGAYLVTYSAECSVDAGAGDRTAYLDIDLQMDGVPIAPTAGDADALCTANGDPGHDGWVRRSITVGAFLSGGTHTLRVLGRLNNAALGGWLGDSAIVIHQ